MKKIFTTIARRVLGHGPPGRSDLLALLMQGLKAAEATNLIKAWQMYSSMLAGRKQVETEAKFIACWLKIDQSSRHRYFETSKSTTPRNRSCFTNCFTFSWRSEVSAKQTSKQRQSKQTNKGKTKCKANK